MNILQIFSATAAAGKTVWSVGLIRAMRDAGIKVVPFKAVSEDEQGYPVPMGRVSLAALHLTAAAGLEPNGLINPVLVIPKSDRISEVWLKGERIGKIGRLGRDISFLDDLDETHRNEVEQVTIGCLKELSKNADIIVAEGSGGATDLMMLNAYDLSNFQIAKLAPTSILVARGSSGGALASIIGTVQLLPEEIRQSVKGFVINDVRCRSDEMIFASRLVANQLNLEFLGSVPWISFFDNRKHYDPFTKQSNEDHLVLAQAIKRYVMLPRIIEWLSLKTSL